MMKIITEIGKNTLPGLDKVDLLFRELKNGKNIGERGKTVFKLENKLEDIFGTPFSLEIEYIGPFSDNFVVIPMIKKTGKIETKEDIVKLGSIKKMNIIMGMQLVNESRPRELTAIMLHEIGHVAGHISHSIIKIQKTIFPINKISKGLSKIPILGLLILPISIITSRTLKWTNHIGEYSADKFAAKYGYGDELSSVIHKWHLTELRSQESSNSFFRKLSLFIDYILNKLIGSTHPKDVDRIKTLAEEMKNNYTGKYKSRRLQKILDYYKLDS